MAYVAVSTISSLELLLVFLKEMKIRVAGVTIGNLQKQHVVCYRTDLEQRPAPAMIVAYAVEISADAQEEANKGDVPIFVADNMDNLFDLVRERTAARRETRSGCEDPVFPVELEIVRQRVYRDKNPIVLDVIVRRGLLRPNTPLCAVSTKADGTTTYISIGRVAYIHKAGVDVDKAEKHDTVGISIVEQRHTSHIMYGRHFTREHRLYSVVTRESVDLLKSHFRSEVDRDSWEFIRDVLKPIFKI